jgi:hypothetical protein
MHVIINGVIALTTAPFVISSPSKSTFTASLVNPIDYNADAKDLETLTLVFETKHTR